MIFLSFAHKQQRWYLTHCTHTPSYKMWPGWHWDTWWHRESEGNCDQRWSHPAIIALIIAADPNYAPAPGSAADILCLVLTRHQMWPHQARVPREDPGYSQASQEWAEHYDIKTAQPAHNILNTQSWSTPTSISCVTTTTIFKHLWVSEGW